MNGPRMDERLLTHHDRRSRSVAFGNDRLRILPTSDLTLDLDKPTIDLVASSSEKTVGCDRSRLRIRDRGETSCKASILGSYQGGGLIDDDDRFESLDTYMPFLGRRREQERCPLEEGLERRG